MKGQVCFTSSSLKKWVNISPSKCRPEASGKEAYLLNGESNKLGKRRTSSSELAGVDDDGGLTIAWEFMLRKFTLRKEEGSGNHHSIDNDEQVL